MAGKQEWTTGARQLPDEYGGDALLFEAVAALSPGDRRRDILRGEIVELYLPLAEHIARRFSGRGEPKDDLVQVARVGLINAVDRYEPGRGSDFLSFAVPTIMGEVRRYFRDSTWSVRVPRRLKELNRSITQVIEPLGHRLERAPKPSEIATELRVSVGEVREGLLVSNAFHAMSVDKPIMQESETVSLGDTLGDYDAELESVENHEALQPLLRELPPRERTILILRFFGNMTQTQIGEQLGISQMHVSRLLSQTLDQLRARLLEEPD